MATQEEHTTSLKEKIQSGASQEEQDRVYAMNLGGEGAAVNGAPVIISPGLFVTDAVEHARMLRENPPIAQVPAQDPTPLDDAEEGVVPTGRAETHPAQGGPGAVRRVDDRTPDSAIEMASQPYNSDASARQVGTTGRDTTEEEAEGKPVPAQTQEVRDLNESEAAPQAAPEQQAAPEPPTAPTPTVQAQTPRRQRQSG